ncbi:MAG TPA: hypothetical protein VIN75_18075 [Burkholderiaceae bacterium]|jgi:hypothetical protein
MRPVPKINELQQTPNDFLPFDAALAARPSRVSRSQVAGFSTTHMQADELGIGALLRFKSMMAHEGQVVHLARLCYDKLYAYERIAAAHASSDENLRRLALELFQIYHRRAATGLPAQ